MEELITIEFFANQLIYYVKLIVFVNKGSSDDQLLKRCIDVHNKLCRMINEDSQKTDEYISKCMKRLNLVLKVAEDGQCLCLEDKSLQTKMAEFRPHSSVIQDDIKAFMEYADANGIEIMRGVNTSFILHTHKYQSLVWEYTRSLFFISQFLIIRDCVADEKRAELMRESSEHLEKVLIDINDMEKAAKIHQEFDRDAFLNEVLSEVKNPDNTDQQSNQAGEKLKELLREKGIESSEVVNKFINSISSRMGALNRSRNRKNIGKKVVKMAFDVARDMKKDLRQNPEALNEGVNSMIGVFQDFMKKPDTKEKVPNNLKNLFNVVLEKTQSGKDGDLDLGSIIDACGDADVPADIKSMANMDPNTLIQSVTGMGVKKPSRKQLRRMKAQLPKGKPLPRRRRR